MNQVSYAITEHYPGTFDEAVTDITKSLSEEGFGILTQIDVKEILKKKLDVDYPRYMILGACNPPNAYKVLQEEIEIGLLLPCNVIVREEGNEVIISVIKPTDVITLSNNTQVANIAKEVEEKLTQALKNAVGHGSS